MDPSYKFLQDTPQSSSKEGGGASSSSSGFLFDVEDEIQVLAPSALRWSPIPDGEFSDWVAWLHDRVRSRRVLRAAPKPRHIPPRKPASEKRQTKAEYMRIYRARVKKKKAALMAAIISEDWVPKLKRGRRGRRRSPSRGARRRS